MCMFKRLDLAYGRRQSSGSPSFRFSSPSYQTSKYPMASLVSSVIRFPTHFDSLHRSKLGIARLVIRLFIRPYSSISIVWFVRRDRYLFLLETVVSSLFHGVLIRYSNPSSSSRQDPSIPIPSHVESSVSVSSLISSKAGRGGVHLVFPRARGIIHRTTRSIHSLCLTLLKL